MNIKSTITTNFLLKHGDVFEINAKADYFKFIATVLVPNDETKTLHQRKFEGQVYHFPSMTGTEIQVAWKMFDHLVEQSLAKDSQPSEKVTQVIHLPLFHA